MRMWGARLAGLLLLLLLQPIFSLQEYEMPCSLPSDYQSFWQYAQWRHDNRNVIPLSVGDIYSDKLQATQNSLGMLGWDLEDEQTLLSYAPDEIGGSKAAANAKKAEISRALLSASNAKKTYSDEVVVYNKVSDEVRSLGALASYRWLFGWYFNGDKLFPMVPWKLVVEYAVKYADPLRPELGLIKFTDYAKYWQQSARAQLDAMSALAQMGNSAFLAAEGEAAQLHFMGVMQEGFPPNARDAYLNWAHFTSSIKPACLGQDGAQPENESLAHSYSLALWISREMQEETLEPHPAPSFFAEYGGQVLRPSDMAAMLAGYKDSSLLKGAWERQSALASSRQAAIRAFESEKAAAEENIGLAESAIAKARSNSPEKFIGYESLPPAASSFSKSRAAGPPKDRLFFAETAYASAKGGYSKADGIYGAAARQGYLADALPIMRASRKDAESSLNASLELLSNMEWLSSQAQEGAVRSLSLLREKMQRADSSTSQGLSSYKSAAAMLEAADSEYAKAMEAGSLGERFRLSMSAKSRADEAAGILAKKDNSQTEWEYSREIGLARSLVASLKASCPEYLGSLERNVQWAGEQFDAIPEAATADKLGLAQGYSASAKAALSECFAPLMERYASLSERINALSESDRSLPDAFERAFGAFVAGDGQWSGAAYGSMGKLNSLLSAWEQRADGLQEAALQETLCKSLRLYPVGHPYLRTGEFASISRRMQAHAAYPLGIDGAFGMRCGIEEDLSGFSLSEMPPYVRYADAGNKSVAIYFASLPPNAAFTLVFSKNGTLFSLEKTGANVTLGPDGGFIYSESGAIKSEADADSLDVYAMLPQGLSSPALSYGGKRISGIMVEENNAPHALFRLPGVREGAGKYSLSASGMAAISESDYAISNSSPSGELSHRLAISNLPAADILDATLSDMAAMDSDSIRIASDSASVELVGAKRAGSPSYRFRVSPSPESFFATVYFRTNDLALSARNTYGLLASEAQSAGYEDAGRFLPQAKSLIETGEYAKALSMLSKVEGGISELRQLREANRQYSDSLAQASAFLSEISGAGAPEGGAFAKDIFKISNGLSSAISEAQSLNRSGSQKPALSKVRSALFDAMSSSREKTYAQHARQEEAFSSLAGSMSLSGLDFPPSFNDAKSALNELKIALQSGNSSSAIEAAMSASEKMGQLNSDALALSSKSYGESDAALLALKSQSQALSDRAESYSSSLSSLRSSSSLFSPILEAKAARDLSSSAQSSVASAEKASASPRTLPSLAEFKKKIQAANSSLQAASSRLDEAYSQLSSAAQAKCRIAQSGIAAMPEGGAKQSLQEELEAANSQTQGNPAEAILRCEGMVARISGKSPQQQNFPIEIAALTLLLAAGLAYVFFRKPPGKILPEKKKLENFADSL